MQFDQAVDLAIVCVGTFLHLKQVSPIGMNDPTAMKLVPNAASTVLTITLLAALTKWRPIRGPPRPMSLGQAILRVLLETSVIIFSVELLLIWIWIPILVLVSGICEWTAEKYLGTPLADWMNDGFYVLRFLLATSLAGTIAVLQGWQRTKKNGHRDTEQNAANRMRRFRSNIQEYDLPMPVVRSDRTLNGFKPSA